MATGVFSEAVGRRGAAMILRDCALLGGGEERAPALGRLETRLGTELTWLLLRALTGDHRGPSCERRSV